MKTLIIPALNNLDDSSKQCLVKQITQERTQCDSNYIKLNIRNFGCGIKMKVILSLRRRILGFWGAADVLSLFLDSGYCMISLR